MIGPGRPRRCCPNEARCSKCRHAAQYGLTRRELEVLRLVATSMTNRKISGRLGISISTTTRHVQTIFYKLHFDNRTALAVWAVKQGLVKA
jgi:DNA-binding CsgD family transcriptional regulator